LVTFARFYIDIVSSENHNVPRRPVNQAYSVSPRRAREDDCTVTMVAPYPKNTRGKTLIRIAVYSEDNSLHALLTSSLSNDFQILFEAPEDCAGQSSASQNQDLVLLDLKSNKGALRQRIDYAKSILASGVRTVLVADDELHPVAMELCELGAYDFFSRKTTVQHMETILHRAHENAADRRRPSSIPAPVSNQLVYDKLIGSSPQMKRLSQLIISVADLSATVLVTGESGTGKELIARAIHMIGNRSHFPFVPVAAGAIPETLLEAELFGHEKGAFTGTVGARKGYFEEAGRGTIFLDEIGDLSMSAQVMLLRVLQQREFSRLGSSHLIPMRARLIFATHKNLEKMVTTGEFRADLYYRINVVRIVSPALREHPEDIPAIADHYVRLYAQMYHKSVTHIEPEVIQLLQAQSWRGNVRELENVLQTATILARGKSIRVEDIPLPPAARNVVGIQDCDLSGSFEFMVRNYKVKLAEAAIRENKGNKSQAARSLSISRTYLHQLLRLAEDSDAEMSDAEAKVV
jgi:DNA-binding NtrC family response regulator